MTSYVPAKEFEGELWVKAADFQKAVSEAEVAAWQGLTDEEMHECWDSPLTPLGMKHARMIEAKLKEKNHAG